VDMINLQCLSLFIKANSPKANRASRLRIARSVAVFVSLCLGIGLFTGVSPLKAGSVDAINPKTYIRLHYSSKEALCLIRLYGKESAFNPRAIGNEDGIRKAYGIPQLKSEFIKDLSANKQIDYGMRYVAHRYGTPCKAWAHSVKKGWY
jgi:hypothetical protein